MYVVDTHVYMFEDVRRFFVVGQFAVRKNVSFGWVRLGQIRLGSVRFFFYGELSYGEKS